MCMLCHATRCLVICYRTQKTNTGGTSSLFGRRVAMLDAQRQSVLRVGRTRTQIPHLTHCGFDLHDKHGKFQSRGLTSI